MTSRINRTNACVCTLRCPNRRSGVMIIPPPRGVLHGALPLSKCLKLPDWVEVAPNLDDSGPNSKIRSASLHSWPDPGRPVPIPAKSGPESTACGATSNDAQHGPDAGPHPEKLRRLFSGALVGQRGVHLLQREHPAALASTMSKQCEDDHGAPPSDRMQ